MDNLNHNPEIGQDQIGEEASATGSVNEEDRQEIVINIEEED